jgi:hypothetical protein
MYLVCVGDGKYNRVEFLQLFNVMRSNISQFSTTTVYMHVRDVRGERNDGVYMYMCMSVHVCVCTCVCVHVCGVNIRVHYTHSTCIFTHITILYVCGWVLISLCMVKLACNKMRGQSTME